MCAEPSVKHEPEQLISAGENAQALPWPSAETPQYYTAAQAQQAAADQSAAAAASQADNKAGVAVDAQQAQVAGMQEGLEKSGPSQDAASGAYQTPTGSTQPSIHPQPGQPMDLHENGTLLQQFGATTADSEVPGAPQNVGQTVTHSVAQSPPAIAPSSVSQGMSLQVTQNGTQAMPQQSHEHAQTVRVVTATGVSNAGAPMQHQRLPTVGKEIRKPARMPGTKQCPTCQGTIAAAVAKCPKCNHVFRMKKEKPKRSGKRGKKNCPKCQFENPSACSTCKSCTHVFRLKLMDRYKQMRPRANEANVGNASAVAVSAVANLGVAQVPTAPPPVISTSGSLPMPSGVQQYHPQIQTHVSQPMHPSHPVHGGAPVSTSVIPPLSVAMHHTAQPHNVHSNVQGHHQIPQHQLQLHPHQPHPQL